VLRLSTNHIEKGRHMHCFEPSVHESEAIHSV
jgi:hypothetical protein